MAKRIGIEVSLAISEAVKLANVDAIAAYPITPQTHIVEHLSELVADGELQAEFIPVESEHSAMSVCAGTSAAGARTYTATSSQGLALMNEILFIIPAMRLPVVMTIANRSLSGPISIWNDHSDLMSVRDTGWIAIFAENGQEAFDLTLQSFKIAEDHRVMLPISVNIDGFTLSHVIEPHEFLDQAEVDSFLPPYEPLVQLNPDKPVSMGMVGIPEIYFEAKKAQDMVLIESKAVIKEVFKEFGEKFGRYYHVIESYRTDDAETLLMTMGSISETAMEAIDIMKDEQGRKVGLIRLRLWRPFPHEELRELLRGVKTLAVVDRAVSFGSPGGPVATEVRSALYNSENAPYVASFIAGLGGRDVTIEHFTTMVDMAERMAEQREVHEYKMIGVRE
ncbi:MAG: pyruvate ferredoxin oxidoreductase [Deltaproteobacteria bacterium]|nr:pyruvate ferredoxin oxidoreductase [Candidatus Anaeroferrophillus wilburensis]MBN2888655.1 pyruvate ferredoxin oxidoreductase [Deltaproteobacteria bacterium]